MGICWTPSTVHFIWLVYRPHLITRWIKMPWAEPNPSSHTPSQLVHVSPVGSYTALAYLFQVQGSKVKVSLRYSSRNSVLRASWVCLTLRQRSGTCNWASWVICTLSPTVLEHSVQIQGCWGLKNPTREGTHSLDAVKGCLPPKRRMRTSGEPDFTRGPRRETCVYLWGTP